MAKNISRLFVASKLFQNVRNSRQIVPRLSYSTGSSAPQNQLPKPPRTKQPLMTWKGLGVIAVGAAVALAVLKYVQSEKDAAIEKERKRSLGKASIGGSWELLDTKGNKRTSEDFKGRWCLIYFGFTHCPDVCPDELEKMAKIVNALDKENVDIQPLFITVDPQRDSNVMLDKYTKEFSPKLLGLTGTQQQIASVCKKFRVYFSAGPKDQDNDYIVDHTIVLYLINPNGEFVDYFGQNKLYPEVTDTILFKVAEFNRANKKGLW